MKKTSGFSLVELMIAAAAIGGIALVGMQIIKTQEQSKVSVSSKMDEIDLRRNITLVLQDSRACEATFNGKTIGQSLDSINNSAGAVAYTKNQKYGSTNLKITSLSTEDLGLSNGKLRDVNLVVNVTKSIMAKSSDLNFKIKLKVVAPGPASIISGCFSDLEGAIVGATTSTCKSLGGSWESESSICKLDDYILKAGGTMSGPLIMEKGDITIASGGLNVQSGNLNVTAGKICIGSACRTFASQKCADGMAAVGITENGMIECEALKAEVKTIVNCYGSWNSCSKTCGGGIQTYSIFTQAQNGGQECSFANAQQRECNTNPCVCPEISVGVTNGTCTIPATNGGSNGSCTVGERPMNCTSQPIHTPLFVWTCPLDNRKITNRFDTCTPTCLLPPATVTKYCNTSGAWN